MDIRTPRDIGREITAYRSFLRLKQSEVARACGVSRQWISALEHGKPTLELGLVLRALETLGIDLAARRPDDPPKWTIVPTADAEMREWRSLRARRIRRLKQVQHARNVRAGNVVEE